MGGSPPSDLQPSFQDPGFCRKTPAPPSGSTRWSLPSIPTWGAEPSGLLRLPTPWGRGAGPAATAGSVLPIPFLSPRSGTFGFHAFLTQAQVKSLKVLSTAFTDFVALKGNLWGECFVYCQTLDTGMEGEVRGFTY